MNADSRFGLKLLGTAIALGVTCDLLLRDTAWGLNVAVLTTVLALVVVGLARWGRLPLEGGGRWLLLPAVGFGICFAWRDSTNMKVCDVLAILTAFGLVAWRSRQGQIRRVAFTEAATGLLVSVLNCVFGVVLLVFKDIQWKELPGSQGSRNAVALSRGLLIALPILLVFGGLFMAADAGFEHIVNRLFHFDLETIVSHVFLIGFFTWTLAGFLRHALENPVPIVPPLPRDQIFTLGIVELGTVLGLLDLLFLAFLGVQVGYLFGGRTHLFAVSGLTAADYARRGFFELVAVAALVLPLLLLADWLLRKDSPRIVRLFQGMAGALVGLTFAVMFSAGQRLWLYHVGFGLTETRFYVAAFMVWLASVFVWFAWTALRGHRQRFLFGTMVTAFGCLVLLHLLNPDAFIVNANVARLQHGHTLDAHYILGLSADATPALVASLSQLPPDTRTTVVQALWNENPTVGPEGGPVYDAPPSGNWPAVRHGGWRSWSWSRAAAYRALRNRHQ
ncbi:MAG: hypothetical protein JWL77_815 [Chthonomonadaceae bacterium]|nr:hypothetical protein [Chthonomonadaceae bacterium]